MKETFVIAAVLLFCFYRFSKSRQVDSGSQSVAPNSSASASPGNVLEMQVLRPRPSTAESKLLWAKAQTSLAQQALWVILMRAQVGKSLA